MIRGATLLIPPEGRLGSDFAELEPKVVGKVALRNCGADNMQLVTIAAVISPKLISSAFLISDGGINIRPQFLVSNRYKWIDTRANLRGSDETHQTASASATTMLVEDPGDIGADPQETTA